MRCFAISDAAQGDQVTCLKVGDEFVIKPVKRESVADQHYGLDRDLHLRAREQLAEDAAISMNGSKFVEGDDPDAQPQQAFLAAFLLKGMNRPGGGQAGWGGQGRPGRPAS